MGRCPNCAAEVQLEALTCEACNADFSAPGGWRPVRAGGRWDAPPVPVDLGFSRLQSWFGTGVALTACYLLSFTIGLLIAGVVGISAFWLLGAAAGYSLIVGGLIAPLVSLVLSGVVMFKTTDQLLRSFVASIDTHRET